MSLESELSELNSNIKALTEALIGLANAGAAAADAADAGKLVEVVAVKEPNTPKKSKGKSKAAKESAPVEVEDDLDLDSSAEAKAKAADPTDDLDLDDDLGLDDEPEVSRDDVRKLLVELGKKKGRDAAISLLKEFKVSNFNDLKDSDLPAVYKKAQAALG